MSKQTPLFKVETVAAVMTTRSYKQQLYWLFLTLRLYVVEGARPRGTPKRTQKEVVEERYDILKGK